MTPGIDVDADIECPAYDEPVHFTPIDFGKDEKAPISPTESVLSTTLPLPVAPAPTPSIRLLFSLLSQRQRVTLLAPALASSVVAGGIAPFMTLVIGQSFDAFAAFPRTPPFSAAAQHALLHSVGLAALQLVALAAGCMLLSSVTSALWIGIGEHNVAALRKMVYREVMSKDMPWFDTKMGADGAADAGPVGAGGLMAKFAR